MVCRLDSPRLVAPALAVLLAGCSMHPLPENHPLSFARASTFDIVQRVRCEAKEGLERQRNRGGPSYREHIKKIIEATSIGYDFEFIVSEHNQLRGELAWLRPDGPRKLKVDGSVDQERSTKRNFRIIETLADVANIKAEDCPDKPGPNLAYPISGSLHIDEVVRTYIQLERISDLKEQGQKPDDTDIEDLPFKGQTRPGVFSETLKFKTALLGEANPQLTLSVVAGSFRLNTAKLGTVAERRDVHSLIVVFAQAPDFKDEQYNRKVRKARAQRRALVGKGNKFIRGAKTEAAIAQASTEYASNQVALELSRLRNLLDDEQDRTRFLGQQLLRALRPPDETGPGD